MPDAVDGDLDLPLAVQALVCALDHCEGYRRALGGAIGGDEHVIVGDLDDPIPRAGGDGGNRLARSPSRCSRRRDMTRSLSRLRRSSAAPIAPPRSSPAAAPRSMPHPCRTGAGSRGQRRYRRGGRAQKLRCFADAPYSVERPLPTVLRMSRSA
jgi:hypothetical protein